MIANLTMPISPYLPVGSILAWETPYQTEEIATLARNGAELFYISMGTGTGTRLLTPGYGAPGGAQVLDLPLSTLVDRPTLVLRIEKGAHQEITAAEVANALREYPGWTNEALMLNTGWGDGSRWESLGEQYTLHSPYLTVEAADLLVEQMSEHGTDLLLTDCAYLDQASRYARNEWAALAPWLRPPWPSPQAQAYVRHYGRDKVAADWPATLRVTREASVVAGLVGTQILTSAWVRVTILPMFIEQVAEAPCTVVAEMA
jgi:kynurenine formamidase